MTGHSIHSNSLNTSESKWEPQMVFLPPECPKCGSRARSCPCSMFSDDDLVNRENRIEDNWSVQKRYISDEGIRPNLCSLLPERSTFLKLFKDPKLEENFFTDNKNFNQPEVKNTPSSTTTPPPVQEPVLRTLYRLQEDLTQMEHSLLKIELAQFFKRSHRYKPLIPQRYTALHMVAQENYTRLLAYLLKTDEQSHINTQTADGQTPLHLAVLEENQESVSMLIKAGANKKIENNKGETPESLALGTHILFIVD